MRPEHSTVYVLEVATTGTRNAVNGAIAAMRFAEQMACVEARVSQQALVRSVFEDAKRRAKGEVEDKGPAPRPTTKVLAAWERAAVALAVPLGLRLWA